MEFLASDNTISRPFICRQLYGHLLAHASELDEQEVQALSSRISQSVNFTIFLDTNVVFSLLNLHENPSNAVVTDLLRLLDSLQGRVNVKLYVLPITIDETRRTLISFRDRIRDIHFSKTMGTAILNIEDNLSGIFHQYVRAVSEQVIPITPSEYFAPYIDNLVSFLRTRNVELYNNDITSLMTSQPVVDDLLEQEDREKGKQENRQKGYEAIKHDVLLWHSTNRIRQSYIESPLDAKYWIVTVDNRLLGFDSYKQRTLGGSIPICLHPNILLQILQLWLPKSQELEKALIHSLRSMVPQEFDAAAEEITIQILKTISQYENSANLDEEIMTSILMNKALRQKLSSDRDINEQIQLVESVIVDELKQVKEELEREKSERGKSDLVNHNLILDIKLKQNQLSESKQMVNEKEVEFQSIRNDNLVLRERIAALENENTRRDRLLFFIIFILASIGVGYLFSKWIPKIVDKIDYSNKWEYPITASLLLALWSLVWIALGNLLPNIKNWNVFNWSQRFGVWIINLVFTIIIGFLTNQLPSLTDKK